MGVFWYKIIKLFKKFFLVLKPLFLTRSIEVVGTIGMPLAYDELFHFENPFSVIS